jgi:hypothetical protein
MGLGNREKHWLFALVVFALGIRLAAVYLSDYKPDPGENGIIAANLAAGKGFRIGAWFGPENSPSAVMPPVYPFFLSLFYRVFPGNPLPYVQVVQAVLAALTLIPVFFTARRLFDNPIAWTATVLTAVSPFMINTTLIINKPAVNMFFVCWLVFYLTDSTNRPLLLGLFFGLCTLVSPDIMVFMVFYLGCCWWRGKDPKSILRKIALVLGGFLLVISPWLVRNYLTFDRFVPITSNLGLNFWMGSSHQASGSQYPRGKREWELEDRVYHAVYFMNEPERFDYLFGEGVRYAITHPYRYGALRLKSFFYFWFTHYQWADFPDIPQNRISKWATVFMIILAFIGMGISGYPQSRILLLFFTSYTLLYTITHADIADRYRLVLDPYLLMFVSIFLWRFFSKIRNILIKIPKH